MIDMIIDWLLEGDVAIQYQVHRDLLSNERKNLQNRIATEGWGYKFLSRRRSDGHWGMKFYQPKWTSTHYTLLDLRNLCIHPDTAVIKESLAKIVTEEKGPDGGIRPIGPDKKSDVCLNGMFLNYASYFKTAEDKLRSIVDFILSEKMPDAEAVIVFSCAGRIISLGPLMNKEIAGISKIWNAPMAGFFSMGEIARATDGKNDLHNLTTCCVALKEK